ncbi:hypothetical protein UPYG_G00295800 [Umbra pygmaea]|uniref:UBA domain-containing protein n=1 Tax=Umbra pygmaea TaxID=75934 RepID=A0ABD0W5M0_UMBPY
MSFLPGWHVLRWTLRSATCTVLSRRQNIPQQPVMSTCRLYCSTDRRTNQPSLSPKQLQPGRDLSLQALLDMGFTDAQADQILEQANRSRGSKIENAASMLMTLFVLGLNTSSVVKVLQKCPEVMYVNGTHLQQRIDNLRRLGLLEGSLQRVVSHYPPILTLPLKRVNMVARFFREKCAFTVQQVTEILRDSPAVLQTDLGQLEYKFQYAYFRIGVRQPEMVKSKLFRVTLDEVRCRHSFLERRGLYQTPDKKGQTCIINPKLNDFLNVPEETFLNDIAKATQEEFEVFQKLMAKEWQEEDDEQERDTGADSDDDDDDEEEEEEEDLKSGYSKRK